VDTVFSIIVNWSGLYPNLCAGKWSISINGKVFPIPKEKINKPMNTFKTYSLWSFDTDYSEIWEDEDMGLEFDLWIKENAKWLYDGFKEINIKPTMIDLLNLYFKIKELDWVHGSCGGCI